MKVIFEDDIIKVVDNERDYDFIGYIENKSDEDIKIIFDDIDYEDWPIKIAANDWVGFLANQEGYDQFEMMADGKYTFGE